MRTAPEESVVKRMQGKKNQRNNKKKQSNRKNKTARAINFGLSFLFLLYITRVSKKFCNILVRASLRYVY